MANNSKSIREKFHIILAKKTPKIVKTLSLGYKVVFFSFHNFQKNYYKNSSSDNCCKTLIAILKNTNLNNSIFLKNIQRPSLEF